MGVVIVLGLGLFLGLLIFGHIILYYIVPSVFTSEMTPEEKEVWEERYFNFLESGE